MSLTLFPMNPFQRNRLFSLNFCYEQPAQMPPAHSFHNEQTSAPSIALDDINMLKKDTRMSLAANSCILHNDASVSSLPHFPLQSNIIPEKSENETLNSMSSDTSNESRTKSEILTPSTVTSLATLARPALGRITKKISKLNAMKENRPRVNSPSSPIQTIQKKVPKNIKKVDSAKKGKAKKSRPAKPRIVSPLSKQRKSFLCQLLARSSRRGYLTCKLCSSLIWGPNGRYHMETCQVLSAERKKAAAEGIKLQAINGIEIHEELFAQPKTLVPKAAKIPGFVMSNTVLRENQHQAPTRAQQNTGDASGRKGYVRCLACNTEVFAPNTRRHAKICWYMTSRPSGSDVSLSANTTKI